MKLSKTQVLGAVFAGLMALSAGAHAHGNEDHAKKSGPVEKEQQDWGIAADAPAAKRTIEIKMSDAMRFSPDKIEVKQGETVKFVIKNDGKVMHEFVLGTKKVLDEHAALMMKFPDMEHDEPYMAHVKPGASGEIVWTFNRAGDFDFACLIAGHYQAGMVGKVKVVASARRQERQERADRQGGRTWRSQALSVGMP
ncbi:cupredoxin family protein [Paucibacter sp. O1-1]|nr:cupredoxin family protein [Paucibacter sp. O1-1]MDA3824748.1 cupredoxin family protein [Paucibacter sp. O1-1]